MKKILLLAVMMATSLMAVEKFDPKMWAEFVKSQEKNKLADEQKENERMCNICKKKVTQYKAEMRDDDLAIATLKNYERRLNQYCSKQ